MYQAFRHDQHDPVCASGEQLAVDDQAGFDGLAQTYFVRQQHAGRHPVGDLMANMQLVGNGRNARAAQPPQRALLLFAAMLQALIAQGEPI